MEFPADNLRLVQTSHRGAHDGDEEVEEDGQDHHAVDAVKQVNAQSDKAKWKYFGIEDFFSG